MYSSEMMKFSLKEVSKAKYSIIKEVETNGGYSNYFKAVERNVTWGGVTFSFVGFKLMLVRNFSQHILSHYFPSVILVMVSWISFMVPPEVVPGRMALLITLLLVKVNLLGTVIRTQPPSNSSTLLVVWIIGCITFITAALFAYAALLWFNRLPLWKFSERKSAIKVKPLPTGKNSKPALRTVDERLEKMFKNWDRTCLMIFPLAFFMFNLIYWPVVIAKHMTVKNSF